MIPNAGRIFRVRFRAPCLLPALVLIFPSAVFCAPQIACRKPVHRFGTVDSDVVLKHSFTIENKGDSTLRIGRLRGCCGAEMEIADRTIPPGSNTALNVRLALRNRRGEQRKSFYVASNDPNTPYFQLRFIGTAVAAVDIAPRTVKFGSLTAAERAEKTVNINCREGFGFNITNAVCEAEEFTVRIQRTGGREHEILVRTVPPIKKGVTRATVKLLTDHAELREIGVPVLAAVSGDLVVVPSEITLVETKGDAEPLTRYIAVRSRTGKAFRVIGVVPPDPGIAVRAALLGGSGYRFKLENLTAFPDLGGKSLIIKTDHEEGREIAVPFKVVPGEK
ncbi:MAG: DUF1573 domain-containing protein [Kiritimatiellia bacterium]